MPTRPSLTMVLLLTAALVGCAAVILAGCGGGSAPADSNETITGNLPEQGGLLFVLRGPASLDNGRLEVGADRVEWLTDIPDHRAGVAPVDELASHWEDYGFAKTPPNAAFAGPGVDGIVELSDPQATADGITFAFKEISGELEDTETADETSLYIDSSSSYDTDMHVYVKSSGGGWCDTVGGSDDKVNYVEDPSISNAPGAWSYYPASKVNIDNGGQEAFTAASKSGSTDFTVSYQVICELDGFDEVKTGSITLKGSVPDNPFDSNSFSCSASGNTPNANQAPNYKCSASHETGYHVTATATLSYAG